MSSASDKPPGGTVAAGAPVSGGSVSRRIAVNTVSNWVTMGIQVGTNLFFLAYVLRFLDKEIFGVFRLAVSLSTVVGLCSFGMAASVLRLASETLAAKNWEGLSDILSVSRTLLTATAGLGMAILVVVAVFFLDALKVPEPAQQAAAFLVVMEGLKASLSLVGIVYHGSVRACQRYDLSNVISCGDTVLQIALVVTFFEAGWVSLFALGVGRLIPSVLSQVGIWIVMHRLLPKIRLSYRKFTRAAFSRVLSFGVWTGVKMISRTIMEEAATPIVSATLGIAAVASIAIPQLMAQFLVQVVNGLTLTLWPIAAGYAVAGQRENLGRLFRVSTRLAMIMLVPSLAVSVTHGDALICVLKPELAGTYYVMLVYLGMFFARAAAVPADHLVLASGSIRSVAVSTFAAAAVGVPLGLAAAFLTDWGIYGILVVLFTPIAIQSLVYLPYQVRKEMGVGFRTTFLGCMAWPVVGGVVPLAAGWCLVRVWPPTALWQVLLQMVMAASTYGAVAWFLILHAEERQMMLRVVRRR